MSRVIKFRAWNKEEHSMGEPFTLEQAIRTRPAVDPTDNCEYMQFTGLFDKNGKEIYEGDIVAYEGMDKIEYERVPDLLRLGHTYGEHLFVPECTWVVGNIYENSDLLK